MHDALCLDLGGCLPGLQGPARGGHNSIRAEVLEGGRRSTAEVIEKLKKIDPRNMDQESPWYIGPGVGGVFCVANANGFLYISFLGTRCSLLFLLQTMPAPGDILVHHFRVILESGKGAQSICTQFTPIALPLHTNCTPCGL